MSGRWSLIWVAVAAFVAALALPAGEARLLAGDAAAETVGAVAGTDAGPAGPAGPAGTDAPAVVSGRGAEPALAAAAAPLELRLRLEVETPGRFIRLADLVVVERDADGVFAAVGETIVRARDGRFVRRADIARRLVRAGLSESSFRVAGPALCSVRPASGAERSAP